MTPRKLAEYVAATIQRFTHQSDVGLTSCVQAILEAGHARDMVAVRSCGRCCLRQRQVRVGRTPTPAPCARCGPQPSRRAPQGKPCKHWCIPVQQRHGAQDAAVRRSMTSCEPTRATSPVRDVSERSTLMPSSCPHCDQPDMSLLRLVLIGEIVRADETLLMLLTDVMQACGLLHLTEEPTAALVRPPQGTLHALRR